MQSFSWCRYIGWMLGTAAVLIVASGLLNLAVDPLGIFATPRVVGLNAIKPHLDHHREFARWRAGKALCAPAGLFGNSRVEIGLDPEHPALAAMGGAVNHAIPGTSVETSGQQIAWLKSVGCAPHTVVLGVEFFDFLGGAQPQANSPPAAPPQLSALVVAETLFSLGAVRDSLSTLALQHAREPASITARGFNPLLNYHAEVRQNGHHVLFRQRAVENIKRWSTKPKRVLTEEGGPSADLLAMEAFLGTAGAGGAHTVHVVLYPYHAQIRLMIEHLGLAEAFSQWKALVVASAQRMSSAQVSIKVWDFSAVGPQTLESIPRPGDRRTKLQHFWEAGHFKKELGDHMLAQMLTGAPGFGRALEATSVHVWLQEDRERVQRLMAQPSELTAEVARLFQRETGR